MFILVFSRVVFDSFSIEPRWWMWSRLVVKLYKSLDESRDAKPVKGLA
jgi:hypothetical protein